MSSRTAGILVALLFASVILPLAVARRVPLKLDPENFHYLFFRGKPVVLVTSGEHYGAVVNLDFDYLRYLDELQRHHLNLTRVFVGSYREISKPHDPATGGYTIDRNTLAPAPTRFLSPWVRTMAPGGVDGAGKFDLARWNPAYFSRLKEFLRQASRRGIVVELTLFCLMYDEALWDVSPLNSKNNINSIEIVKNTEVYNLRNPKLQQAQDALVRKIVTEVRDFDNLYFEIINEPYWHSVTPEWQRHISALISDTEKRSAAAHLISQNYAQFSTRIENPDPRVSLFNFHYSRPPDSVAMNYGLNLAIGVNETGFDGAADAVYRIQGWDFLAAGGTLYNSLDFSFAPGFERGTFQYAPYTPGGGSAALRSQLGHLKKFFLDFRLPAMAPAPEVIAGYQPEGASVRALAEIGKQYAIYIHHGRVAPDQKPQYVVDPQPHSARLRLNLPSGRYRAAWVDTRTLRLLAEESFIHRGGEKQLNSPEYTEDIALRVIGKSAPRETGVRSLHLRE